MISDVLESLPEDIRSGFGMEMDVIRLRPRLQIFELHIVSVGDRGRIDPRRERYVGAAAIRGEYVVSRDGDRKRRRIDTEGFDRASVDRNRHVAY